jgi:hypothetical protein
MTSCHLITQLLLSHEGSYSFKIGIAPSSPMLDSAHEMNPAYCSALEMRVPF